ncbi:hypothetical protein COL154_003811 [Colletotrichum chrysophilum]|uniref:uncharacterized protein n=1 Tax=Colletotrichum chrysophilum TaxID=1836956 RepID=UPI0023013C9C|nr:uncharacterized protein COL26b_002584 [Colletotrichum chrysophilum]KAJ0352009.1 hypothetical protein KNSL1_002999 [Colletotrichum chrysophilum]KAJ0366579.1 hypothetical protein COL154_003811 [Colletotrichum chrysophilum]KAJ0379109.1 hypothetical protein COL26b_002584 [Colletotrichum chrysophilum]
MLLHGAQSPSHALDAHALEADQHQHQQTRQLRRKRKAESQDNERLSKRLSLLNLEKNGQKLYVPVENPIASASNASPDVVPSATPSSTPHSGRRRRDRKPPADDEVMQLDDSKYKVYIYDIDDELSSSESEPEEGKLVFLPDIEKHLRATRIPPHILANDEGQLAGMQMVLYNEPTSLTIPQEQDSVRKAIVESRARMRERQRLEREGKGEPVQTPPPFIPLQHIPPPPAAEFVSAPQASAPVDYDPDAMDMD